MSDPKTILVHVAPNAGDAPHIQAAAGLARLFGAQLVGVGAEAFRPDRDPRLTHLDGLQVAAIRQQIDAELDEAKVQFLGCAAGVATLWTTAYEDPDDLLVRHAARADLIVAAAAPHRPNLRTFAETDDLIFESGVPVLVLRPDQTSVAGRRVVIGWKNTREARRAIGDALPFLKRAEAVSLLAVCEGEDAEVVARELEDVAARLARHGVSAEAEPIVVSDEPVGEVLLQVAQGTGADLIVVGAYGRSRLHAWILGSVTRHLLAHARSPVLFSR